MSDRAPPLFSHMARAGCVLAAALSLAGCSDEAGGSAPAGAAGGVTAAGPAGKPQAAPQVHGAPSAPSVAPGSLAMAELLADLRATASAATDPYLNPLRVPVLEQRLMEARSRKRPTLQLRLALANEKLCSGAEAEAIAEIDSVLCDIEAGSEPITPAFHGQALELLAAAWIRVGEQGNCVMHHGAASCICPIAEAGRHADPTGSQRGIEVLTELLALQPWNLKARWLLNVAAMTVGDWPERVPPEFLVPPEAFASAQAVSPFTDVATLCGIRDRGLAGGVCLDDFDGDGNLDLVVSDWAPASSLHFYRSDGAGRFSDRSEDAGLTGLGQALNLLHADVDNDGDNDVLVLRGARKAEAGETLPFSLLLNDGSGVFADVTRSAGLLEYLCTGAAAFADVDGDGNLDLFVGHESVGHNEHACRLYRGLGDGSFVDVSEASGLDVVADVRGAAWSDYDGDGDPDLALSCAESRPLLFRNDGGRFVETGREAGLTTPLLAGPCCWFDYDNDGRDDLLVTAWEPDQTAEVCRDYLGLEHSGAIPGLYHNRGDGSFDLVTEAMGLRHALPTLGCNVGDIDGDGWLDLYLGTGEPDLCGIDPNRLFRNAEGTGFVDVTTAAGVGHLQKGAGLAFGDLDNDGDQDLFEVMGGFFATDTFHRVLFENPGSANRWVTLSLQGVQAHRSAIGARLRLRVRRADGSSRDIHGSVGTGGSFGSQSLQAEFGLGDATAIEELEVRWPGSGTHQVFRNLPMDRFWRIVEAESLPKPLERQAFPLGGPAR